MSKRQPSQEVPPAKLQVRTRKTPEERKTEIVHAAGAIALKEGIEAVTKRRVAEELGFAPGLVHHYFDSIEALAAEGLTWVLGAELHRTFAAFNEADTALEGIRGVFEMWVTVEATDFGLLWLDAWSISRRRPIIRDAVLAAMHDGHVEVARAVRRGQDEGSFRSGDPDELAWTLLTLLDGMIVHSSLRIDLGLIDVDAALRRFADELIIERP
jgi:AcrR family transcriptional regulator